MSFGRELGVKYRRSRKPNLVMPRLGGLELAKAAAKLSPELKVIAISGCAEDPATWQTLRQLGCSFLAKPFNPEALARLARSVLDENALHAAVGF